MQVSIPRLVIAGASSGVGKTSLTLGITAALRRRGLKVQTFKCGPDYLDPSYHRLASGSPCHNLDSWMMGSGAIVNSFLRSAENCDIALIEGVMGLFDGASSTSQEGSTAEIAKILTAPVVGVIDAGGMARTLAALVLGLKHFDPELAFVGCIANKVGSKTHAELLAQALGDDFLGALPRRSDVAFPERHLGLAWAQADVATLQKLETWADLVEEWVDLDTLLEKARQAPAIEQRVQTAAQQSIGHCRIAVAYDEAFHFYYEENLHRLRTEGAELVFFSPLRDEALPTPIDALYIGGGYPELHAAQLSQNLGMSYSIQAFAQQQKPIYAECGGLMYLCRQLETLDGKIYSMLGLLPARVKMHDRLQALGYVETEITHSSLFGPPGTRFRGHQFRYSELEEIEEIPKIYRVRRKRRGDVVIEGYTLGSVLASYVHAHWASHPGIPRHLVGFLTQKNL